MPENAIYKIEKNDNIARDVYKMLLAGPTGALTRPGQFVNIQLDGRFLRRPISVCSHDAETITLIYKVVGEGTAQMAEMRPGQALDLLVGLGNGFDVAPMRGRQVLLAGGGVGTPPLYGLAQALLADGQPAPQVALGFASAPDVFYQAEFEALGCAVYIATNDGSLGIGGFVTAPMAELDFDYYAACGPMGMLRAIYGSCEARCVPGQLSFEERMGCGFGACMGCSCHTKTGSKRVCVEGPVFQSREVVFE